MSRHPIAHEEPAQAGAGTVIPVAPPAQQGADPGED